MPIRNPSRETVLVSTPRRERAARFFSVLAFLVGTTYVVWRLVATLNTDALWLSVPLWLAEAWTVLTAGLLFFGAWDPFRRGEPPPAPAGRTVDVFVPTLNEPVWVLRRTLVGALAIDYPHRTWLLDDGNRPEMRALAEQLGVGYLPRESSEGAKAGHLNYALERTDGEFVVLFDADHIATPEFLDRTLGWFEDEQVAFVQTPQDFYNIDSFEHDLNQRTKIAWHGQTMFYRLLQPGKDRWNAAFFCGSNAVLRRAALEDVGGFPTETVTEDIHLSIKLHARGWRSVFQREVLAYGLAPQTAVGYQTQRLRWGQGGMQVLRTDNPATIPGLTFPQRLNYMASLMAWFDGWQKVIFYSVPPLFLLTGVLPLRAEPMHFAIAFVVTYGLLLTAAKLMSRGTSKFLLADAYAAATFPVLVKATLGLFTRKRLKFAVTDKEGQRRVPWAAVRWQAMFILVTTAALVVGSGRLAVGAETYEVAIWVAIGWAVLNLGMLSWAVYHTLTTVEQRGPHRVPAFLPIRWEVDGASGLGILENLNEGGGRLRVRGELTTTEITIMLWPNTYQAVTGAVEWQRKVDGHSILGLRWAPSSTSGPHGPLAPTAAQPEDLTALIVMFAQRRFLQHVDAANGARRGRGWRPANLQDLTPMRVLDTWEDSLGLLSETKNGDCVAIITEIPELGARLRFAPWDGPVVCRGTVISINQLRLDPFRVFEVHLKSVARDGQRVPGRDPLPGGRISDEGATVTVIPAPTPPTPHTLPTG